MKVHYEPKALKVLNAKLEFLNGKGSRKLAYDIAAAVELGNQHDRLNGLDRYGKPQPPVKPRRGKYKGATGPPLAPFGAASRVVTRFKASVKGSTPPYSITAGWDGVASKGGFPFLVALDRGVRDRPAAKGKKPRGNVFGRIFARLKQLVGGGWYIPPRPHFGISPNTWVLIRKEIDDFKDRFKGAK